ncbi:MAG: hypothetical protein NVS3B10_03620 [Polyangiales bacterium]
MYGRGKVSRAGVEERSISAKGAGGIATQCSAGRLGGVDRADLTRHEHEPRSRNQDPPDVVRAGGWLAWGAGALLGR